MQNKLILGLFIGIVTLGAVMFVSGRGSTSTTPESVSPTPIPQTPVAITVTGTMVCLPHKNPGEVQTMECAYGLVDDTQTYYALRDSDPAYGNISGVAMNEPVTVVGTFTAEEHTTYPTIGVIEVTSIQRQ